MTETTRAATEDDATQESATPDQGVTEMSTTYDTKKPTDGRTVGDVVDDPDAPQDEPLNVAMSLQAAEYITAHADEFDADVVEIAIQKTDRDDEPTIYERAHRLERVCRNCLQHWRNYKGDELDALLTDDGALDPEMVDCWCPYCGGNVYETLYDEDGGEL